MSCGWLFLVPPPIKMMIFRPSLATQMRRPGPQSILYSPMPRNQQQFFGLAAQAPNGNANVPFFHSERRRVWHRKWRTPGVLASPHAHHGWVKACVARGSLGKNGPGDHPGPCLVEPGSLVFTYETEWSSNQVPAFVPACHRRTPCRDRPPEPARRACPLGNRTRVTCRRPQPHPTPSTLQREQREQREQMT